MTPEQLEEAIVAFCKQHGLRSLSISYEFAGNSVVRWWSAWRGANHIWADTPSEMLDVLKRDPVAQQQWNEERLRAGA